MYYYIKNIEIASDNSQFWGSFYGSSLAFIFGLLTFFVTSHISRKRERFMKHNNALVKLEQLLNGHIDDISILKQDSKDFVALLKQDSLVTSRFNTFKLIEELSLELASISLINQYFSYSRLIMRYNLDFSSINYAFTRLEDAAFSNTKLDPGSRELLIVSILNKIKSLDSLEVESKRLLALARLYVYKNRNIYPTIAGLFNMFNPKISKEELNDEIVKIEKEIN